VHELQPASSTKGGDIFLLGIRNRLCIFQDDARARKCFWPK
jgi:hypothetical protein